ncbi:hypothetical protein AGMMS50276_05870 [Synergistales bacterium]|nr:hypothetical protein AGMMS50276_05870 [Synergistales bacterium]
MNLHNLKKGLLYCAGMISGVAAGNLFYLERIPSGVGALVLTGVFLFYAMSNLQISRVERDDDGGEDYANGETMRILADMSVLLAETAIGGAKRIGRTAPYSATEIANLEDTIMPLLRSLSVSAKERDRISQELEDLRTRQRQIEGRRAISKRF